MKKQKAYAPDTRMCLALAISICLLEKYFANTIIRASLAKSTGWKEKNPRVNHRPCATAPTTVRRAKRPMAITNNATDAQVDRKKLRSKRLTPKKIAKLINIQAS